MQKHQHIIGEDVRGCPIEVTSFHFIGSDRHAPKAYLQASMHGAELQGNAVIAALFSAFDQSQLLGDVIIVPHCNPIGGNHKVGEYTQGRFDPISGENWNRQYFYPGDGWIHDFAESHLKQDKIEIYQQFRQALLEQVSEQLETSWRLSRGRLMTHTLQQLAYQADYVLDLHTGSNAARYLYVPAYAEASAFYFHQEHVLLMDNIFGGALDEASFCPWWTLEQQLHQLGHDQASVPSVEAFTVELGSQEIIDNDRAQYEAQGILAYLSAKGVLPKDAYQPADLIRHVAKSSDFVTFHAPYGGLYEFVITPGDQVEQGQVFARCLRVMQYGQQPVSIDIHAPFSGQFVNQFDSAAVPKGAELAKFLKV